MARFVSAGALALLLVLRSTIPAGIAADAPPGRDMLWHIVSECLDPSRPDYCARCTAPLEGYCATPRPCARTTQIWGETADDVAIRDLKMCGCPLGFVHGLALPRRHVIGVEDPQRPAGLWSFAWNVARQRILDEMQIALVVNSPGVRTQDQLHVHLVRLRPDARPLIAAQATRIASLDEVWPTVARQATGRNDYGVLVVRDEAGGFLVLTATAPIERRFTIAECR